MRHARTLRRCVNKEDEVIGQTTFDDAYANHKIIRVVHNWIMNDEGKLLFQFRGAHKKSMPRHFDASVGGRVDAGETYEQAVIRESQEELGIAVKPQLIDKVFMDIVFLLIIYHFFNPCFHI